MLQRVALVIVVSAQTALAAEAYNPFKIPKAQVLAQVRTIALRPFAIPVGDDDPDAVRQRFESLIADKLHGRFATVPSGEFARIWRQLSERMGGIYDPITGTGDDKKLEVVRDHTARELARQHHVDAILGAFISVDDVVPWVASPFTQSYYQVWGDVLTWHGAPLHGAPINLPQKVLANYLNIILTDLAGVEMYSIRAGIEWVEVFVARGYEERPRTQLYRDAVRNRRAVDVVLDPLVADAKP